MMDATLRIEYAINRYSMETKRLLDVLDKHLGEGGKQYVCGDQYLDLEGDSCECSQVELILRQSKELSLVQCGNMITALFETAIQVSEPVNSQVCSTCSTIRFQIFI